MPSRRPPVPTARTTAKPVGTVTRGTTNPNRLRRVDRWMQHRLGARLRSAANPLVVDLGYGASGRTPAELLDRLRAVAPDAEVLGLEIDPERVAAARVLERTGLAFALGGFEVPAPRAPVAIRAFNVLRQYPEEEVQKAWASMTGALAPGGLLIEGTCDELGRRCVWATLGTSAADADRGHADALPRAIGDPAVRRGTMGTRSGHASGVPRTASPSARAAAPEAGSGHSPLTVDSAARAAAPGTPLTPDTLTVSVSLPHLERPSRVAERLPKALIHRNVAGEPVHALLSLMDEAWDRAAPFASLSLRQRWIRMCEDLRASGIGVHDGPRRWRLGEITLDWPGS